MDRKELFQRLVDSGMSVAEARVIAAEFVTPIRRVESDSSVEATLRKLMETLVVEVAKLGDDVEIRPSSRAVAFRRVRQFAVARPVGSGRVELGLALPTARSTGRLRPASSSSFGSPRGITHVLVLTSAAEVDRQVQEWLRAAYDQDGERRRKAERRKTRRSSPRRRSD